MFSSFLIKEGICSLSDTTHHKNKDIYIYANKNIWITAIFLHLGKNSFQKQTIMILVHFLKIRRKNTQNSCFRVKYGFC